MVAEHEATWASRWQSSDVEVDGDAGAQTAEIDLADTRVAIDGGVHIAALGGIWLTAVFGFAGVSLLDDGLAVDPRLPVTWRSLAFSLQWRGRHLKITIKQAGQHLEATLKAGEPTTLTVNGEPHELRGSETLQVVADSPLDGHRPELGGNVSGKTGLEAAAGALPGRAGGS